MRAKSLSLIALTVIVGVSFAQSPKREGLANHHSKNGTNYQRDSDTVVPSEDEYSPPYNYAAENQRVNREEKNTDYNGRIAEATEDFLWPTIFSTIFSGLAFLLSLVAVIVGVKQWKASHKATHQELRAYVFIDREKSGGMIHKHEGFPRHPLATVYAKNSGQTPAYGAIIIVGIRPDLAENPENLSIENLIAERGKDHVGKSTIPPGEYLIGVTNSVFSDEKSYQSWATAWNAGDATIYVYGVILYSDGFNKKWQSSFRFGYGYRTDPVTKLKALTVTTSPDGNREDEYKGDLI